MVADQILLLIIAIFEFELVHCYSVDCCKFDEMDVDDLKAVTFKGIKALWADWHNHPLSEVSVIRDLRCILRLSILSVFTLAGLCYGI